MIGRRQLGGVALAVSCWAGAATLSPYAATSRAQGEELLYYPSGRFLKEAVLGYGQAAASLAWLRTVQYYGAHKRGDREFDMMYHLCDVVTDLDPRFEEPYVFGSWVLFTDGKRPAQGRDLLAKGLRQNPDSWAIAFENGFVHYVFLRDHRRAAECFRRAASLPGAPEYVGRFAAFASHRAGDLRMAIALWTRVAEQTDNPARRQLAEDRARELMAQLKATGTGP